MTEIDDNPIDDPLTDPNPLAVAELDPRQLTDELGDEGLGLGTKPKSFGRQTLEGFLRHRLAVVGFVTLTTIVFLSLFASRLSPYTFSDINIADRALGPSRAHPFGTDDLGRDLFVRIFDGTWISLKLAFIVAIVSTAVGTVLGALAGYFGRWVDGIITQIINLLLVVPGLVVLIVFAIKFRSTYIQVALVISILSWIRIARIVRGQFLQLKELEFVQAARASGAGPLRIIFRHLIPNVMGPVLVEITLTASAAIILGATLSFLSLGVQPPTPELGNIINEFKGSIDSRPSRVLIPGFLLMAIAMSLNFMGDGLRDALDPRTRKVRQ